MFSLMTKNDDLSQSCFCTESNEKKFALLFHFDMATTTMTMTCIFLHISFSFILMDTLIVLHTQTVQL